MGNQRLLLYLSLGLVLFLIWQAWEAEYGPQPVPPAPPQVSETERVQPTPAQDVPEAAEVPQAAQPELPTLTPQTAENPRIQVITDTLNVAIGLRGGDVLRADLPTFPVSVDQPHLPFRLLDDQRQLYIAQSGLVHDKTRQDVKEPWRLAPSHHALFTTAQQDYRLEDGAEQVEVPLVWRGPDGVTVTKTFTFRRGSFLVGLTHTVTNNGSNHWIGRQYRQLRHGPIR